MKRVLLIIGTRPEAIKCFPVIEALRERDRMEVLVCISGQHREILQEAMQVLGFEADCDLRIMRPRPTLTDITCDILKGLGDVLNKLRPDIVLVQGDTTTAMAASLAAFYAKLPVGHIEAGLVSGTKYSPYPEEINRRLVTVLTDLHFAPTAKARANLIKANVPAEKIYVTGNTVIDALLAVERRLEATKYVSPAIKPVLAELARSDKRLIVVTAHRRESWGRGLDQICSAIATIAKRGDVQIALPVHPNPNVRKPIVHALGNEPGISLLDPLDYVSFVGLMRRAYIVLTDSGGIQEEAPALGKPTLVLRDVTERPEGVDAGVARLVGLDASRITSEAERLLDSEAAYRKMSGRRFLYGDGQAAERIAAIIETKIAGAVSHRQLAGGTRRDSISSAEMASGTGRQGTLHEFPFS